MAEHALDEIQERLTVIYNAMRHLKTEIADCDKAKAKAQAEHDRLDRVASEYVALLASDQEGISA